MITIENLVKAYDKGAPPAINDISLEIPKGTFLTLLGPSGCGKSTTLRSIAGLETPDSGAIVIGDVTAYDSRERINLAPAKRRIGMVFQSYAIWPHMTVAGNVSYPLKRQGVPRAKAKQMVTDALELVGLSAMASRPAPNLSGGQQQRVALARAIVARPEVLLLDEPLSNLDTGLRRDLGRYLRDLQRELGLTVVYVTHDHNEAMSMSDVVVLMRSGNILEQGTPEAIYHTPITQFGASFLGSANFLTGTVTDAGPGRGMISGEAGEIAFDDAGRQVSSGENVTLMLRPDQITLQDSAIHPASGVNHVVGTIRSPRFLGMYWESSVEVKPGLVLTARTFDGKPWREGDHVVASFPPSACIPVDADQPAAATITEGAESK
ncbi:ABC transporter ATP-binding protein [Mycobacterium sp. NAZ190054]|uniref:ABC transporter ATP-binding protein n=1 Tax=Mycobacterium sp. NAZ190054 TaxID=1747766 RepID=UPI00079249E4|nr:ABC transporter ATP-binding protein [Mycobacterium sp. NAZ190054]KWX68854.1 hypothetical protein ASJ79_16005 [Mycobacterium sp. NAZ190054]